MISGTRIKELQDSAAESQLHSIPGIVLYIRVIIIKEMKSKESNDESKSDIYNNDDINRRGGFMNRCWKCFNSHFHFSSNK